ncbi:hypothetical protein M8J76_012184 [Diaphorina citri]|nr:hypothetical protein M8J76_012184 [Diaphorina citri]
MYVCDICGKVYQHKRTLYRHKKDECGQEPRFQCPQCPYRAKQKANLKTHLIIKHDSVKRRLMVIFTSKSFWKVLMRYFISYGTSFKSNPGGLFACDVCGKGYHFKTGLYRHKKDECGQEPKHQCPHCPYRAKQKTNLKSHLRIRHCYQS